MLESKQRSRRHELQLESNSNRPRLNSRAWLELRGARGPRRYMWPVARHPVVTSQSVSGQDETRGAGGGTAGGKKLLEGWLNVPNVNYASGVPQCSAGAQVKKFSFGSRPTSSPPASSLDYGTTDTTERSDTERTKETTPPSSFHRWKPRPLSALRGLTFSKQQDTVV
ncbi:hypothetical protein K0M31_014783 [Melipona bicolor]|uniref:Uncharacterized protein n=1 Tax=Melipona bicolor TaxID=60889 RepID=A0AA40FGU8_9HYME|nr:hypothetical protein K0M31_014783 [Melipona bicolor]